MSLEEITVWSCRFCGFRTQKPAGDFAAVFHPCFPPERRRRRRYSIPEVEGTREELLAEAREQEVIYHSLEDALGGPALRSVDE